MDSTNCYDGDDINIEELPAGCEITTKPDGRGWVDDCIIISSPKDAEALIKSLLRMLQEQFPDYRG